jgi:hypothetical protein
MSDVCVVFVGLTHGKSAVQLNKKIIISSFSTQDSFLSGANAVYVDQMYSAWKKSPDRYSSVCVMEWDDAIQ